MIGAVNLRGGGIFLHANSGLLHRKQKPLVLNFSQAVLFQPQPITTQALQVQLIPLWPNNFSAPTAFVVSRERRPWMTRRYTRSAGRLERSYTKNTHRRTR